MWQYCRSNTSKYYYTCGSTAAVLPLIINTHATVVPQFHIHLLLHMWKYGRSNTSNYYYSCGSPGAVSHLFITKHVAVMLQYNFYLLLHMWKYCHTITSIKTTYVAVMAQKYI